MLSLDMLLRQADGAMRVRSTRQRHCKCLDAQPDKCVCASTYLRGADIQILDLLAPCVSACWTRRTGGFSLRIATFLSAHRCWSFFLHSCAIFGDSELKIVSRIHDSQQGRIHECMAYLRLAALTSHDTVASQLKVLASRESAKRSRGACGRGRAPPRPRHTAVTRTRSRGSFGGRASRSKGCLFYAVREQAHRNSAGCTCIETQWCV